MTLLAICTLVSSRLSPRHLADPASVIPQVSSLILIFLKFVLFLQLFMTARQGEAVGLADLVTSSCGDKDVDEVAAILRLLHIRDLRTLQTQVRNFILFTWICD